jgi:hypothetical protein
MSIVTRDAEAVGQNQLETEGNRQPAGSVTIEPSEYTQCGSYKEAKYLAASRRREGLPTFAVLVTALDGWCVRLPVTDAASAG